MNDATAESRWQRLMTLLEPIHSRAGATARRLSGSRADGEDLFQETVLRAFNKLESLRDPARFPGWFYAVLLSVHRSRSRRASWRRFFSLETAMAQGFDMAAQDRGSELLFRAATRVAKALATLPAVQREAVVLFELDGFSIEEIAELARVTPSAVKSRLGRGRARLRRHYERLGYGGAGPTGSMRAAGSPGVDAAAAPGCLVKEGRHGS